MEINTLYTINQSEHVQRITRAFPFHFVIIFFYVLLHNLYLNCNINISLENYSNDL